MVMPIYVLGDENEQSKSHDLVDKEKYPNVNKATNDMMKAMKEGHDKAMEKKESKKIERK